MKYVYQFNEGKREMNKILGGKGANLAEMTNLGLPVPSGFTISTLACRAYYENQAKLSDELIEEIFAHLKILEEKSEKKFGDNVNPLLVSVRSGAEISMPGMMDTILNLGLNDDTVIAISEITQNERFAYDSYRRFIQMFSDVVMGIPKYKFEYLIEHKKQENNYTSDLDLTTEDLKALVKEFKEIYFEEIKHSFPTNPQEQLLLAIEAVFKSWHNPRAKLYRNINNIPDDLGTAVNIQAMVFGNMGRSSGTGVAFTRNPSTGEKRLFGEYLINAQGEDVVAGIRTPQSISKLQSDMPEIYQEFVRIAEILENHYRDMQDIEFTIERGKLYFLQTRNGKRTARAALKIAVDLVNEGLITKEEAILRIDPESLKQLLHPNFNKQALSNAKQIAKGLPASPGASTGRVFFTAENVVKAKENGVKAILVRQETSPEDIAGMIDSEGILTSRGGMTSHAAVVARGMGKCCVVGCSDITIFADQGYFIVDNLTVHEGEYISIDGSTGKVYLGDIPREDVNLFPEFATFMAWVDEVKRLKVRTNADTARDCQSALSFGAEGIGLCRTEHMFFNEKRILVVQKMILADCEAERRKALELLLPMQKSDFIEIFSAMRGLPCTIRLLDPPLHEFLPKTYEEQEKLANYLHLTINEVSYRTEALKELNPMLGHRGCRVGITYKEIYEMQVEAIFQAAIFLQEQDIIVKPEIMIPLVGDVKEFNYLKAVIDEVATRVLGDNKLDYQVGTMIEVPRACLLADEIAEKADFFSFGTNDLTQMTFGFSRDDASKFLNEYIKLDIFAKDPFEVLDTKGVGKLMNQAVKLGRSTKSNLKLGICGEHGGEPSSIAFCEELGLDYISCSPFRVPIAKLAAAQAYLTKKVMVR